MRILVLVTFFLYKIPCVQTTVLMNCVLGKEKCPVDGGWTLWTLWGPCEGECGAVGRQIRTRTCTNPHPDSNGEDCVGESRQLKQCSVAGCKYEQYEKLLSQNSQRAQQLQLLRKLSGYQPSLLSKCLTSTCEFQDVLNAVPTSADEFWNALLCVKKNTGCPVSGSWGEWSGWTRCSAVCGEGQRMRCRVCCDPAPSSVDYGCPGDSCVYEPCSGKDCKIPPGHTAEGAWSEWSEWSKCNPPCNFGISRRSRICRKGRQNQKRKSDTEDGYMNSFDYDYYNVYYDNNLDKYDLDEKPYDYDPEVAEESKQILRVLKRDDDKCDPQIEFYSTEDDEEYSSSLSPYASTNGDQVIIEPTTQIKDDESTIQQENLELSSKIQNLELSSWIQHLESSSQTQDFELSSQTQDFELSSQIQDFELSSEEKNLEITTEEEVETDFLSKTGYENVQNKFHKDYDETVSQTPHKLSTFALLTSEAFTDISSESENSESMFSDVMESTLLESDTTRNKVDVSDTTLKISTKSSKLKPTGIFTKLKDKSSTSESKTSSKRITLSFKTDNYRSTSKVSSEGRTVLKDEEECKGAFDSDQDPGTMEPECTGELYKGSFLHKPAIADKTGSLQSDALPTSEMTDETPGQNSTLLEPTITEKTGSLQSDTLPMSEMTEETPGQNSTFLEKPTITKKTGSDNSKSVPTSQMTKKTTMEKSTSEILTHNPCENTDNTLCFLFTANKTTTVNTEKLSTVFTTEPSEITTAFATEPSEITTAFTTETSEIPSTTLNITSAFTTKIPTENASSTLYTTFGTSQIPNNNTDSGNETEPTGVSCDLKEVLQLPSFDSNFEVEDCTGPFEEVKPCNVSFCNEDGGWSSWSSWSACSADCGIGKQVTERSCTNPQPRTKGMTCHGDYTLRQPCYLQPCPVKVEEARVEFTSSESKIKYSPLLRYSTVLMLYVRFRPNNDSGEIVSRRSSDCEYSSCDHVHLSLYNGHLLLSVSSHKCHATIFTGSTLTMGEWHDALMTVVGGEVTLSVDDRLLHRVANLSCRPDSPNYDSDMRIGGGFIGEIDKLVVNFQDHALLKRHQRRDIWMENQEESVMPLESPQVQPQVSLESPTLNLDQLIIAPCFANESVWTLELAIRPKFADGIVLFLHGYGVGEFLVVTLEQTRVRLRVKMSQEAGECERSSPVAPQTWLHIKLNKNLDSPISLALNGGEHCLAEAAQNGTEEPSIRCNGGIMVGEVPLSVKNVLDSDTAHIEPVHSPLGVLGLLSVDNRTLDLSLLLRKIPPDLVGKYPSTQYKFSSYSASLSAYYEEKLVLPGEDMLLLCAYDLAGALSKQNIYSKDHDPDVTKYSTNWIKLDLPLETAVEKHTPYMSDNGESSTLNFSGNYTDTDEDFYSCWLHYPFPLQPGFNIISYGVLTAGAVKEGIYWLQDLIIFSLILVLTLISLMVLWLVAESVFDFKYKSGFYRCRKLTGDEARDVLHKALFSDQGILILGDELAAHRAIHRFDKTLEEELRVWRSAIEAEERTSAEEAETSGTEATSDATTEEIKTEEMDTDETKTDETKTTDEKTSEDSSIDVFEDASDQEPHYVKSSITKEIVRRENKHRRHTDPIKTSPRSPQKRTRIVSEPMDEVVVAVMSDEDHLSPFTERSKYPRRGKLKEKDVGKGKLLDNQTISLEELQESEDGSGQSDESPQMVEVRSGDNFIKVPRDWKKREVKTQTSPPSIGIIQNTSAYRNIENELKFLPEKFKDLGKYEIVNKNVKYK